MSLPLKTSTAQMLSLMRMNELTGNNGQLQTHTASSQEMTTDISSQVENVAAMINDMVSLTAESGKHAQVSSEDLGRPASDSKNHVGAFYRG